MLRNMGYFCLLLSFFTYVYGFLVSTFSAISLQRRPLSSAKIASLYGFLLCSCASLCLLYAFMTHDYSLAYVYKNSSNDLPFYFQLSAFWGSLEGSHLLWTLLLSFGTLVAHYLYKKEIEAFIPVMCACLQLILAWKLSLAISSSDPFRAQFPPPENGLGLNELLQNPYMVIHPPCLFTGYICLAIPFALCVSALIYGRMTSALTLCIKQWTLLAWCFLTAGIFLGGRWAYVELGWAGYWAWDPVENSSFIPWLFATASLHSLLLHKKAPSFKKYSIALSFMAFFFSYFGTFITRSGIISSVHSFAQSSVGYNYLYFLATLLVSAVLLFSYRVALFKEEDKENTWGFTKASFLVIAQLLFASFAIIILMGTLYPIISEIVTNIRFNVQAPYFNSFAPYIGFLFMITITLAHLVDKKYKNHLNTKHTLFLFALSVILSSVFIYASDIHKSSAIPLAFQVIGTVLGFFCLLSLFYHMHKRLSNLNYRFKDIVKTQLPSIGAIIAHTGLVVAILGFLGNYRGLSKLVSFQKSQTHELYGYTVLFEGVQPKHVENTILFQAHIKLTKDQKENLMFPARAKYPTKDELIHEIDFFSSFWHDVYMTLIDFDQTKGEWATIEMHINPSVRLVWYSAFLLVLGGLIALLGSALKLRNSSSKNMEALYA